MRKIYFMAAALSLGALSTSCSDFIEQDNKSNIGQPDYYTTKEGFESLSNSSYSMLRTLYGGDPWLYEGGTDLFTTGRTSVPQVCKYGSSYTSSDGNVSAFYANYYKSISLANDVIYWGANASDRAQLVAEARGLRAMYYLTLVQQFGGVPLVIERKATSVTSIPRSSAQAVYEFVINELKDLSEGSALLDKATGTNFGRFDKRAASHFLAKAYLCKGYETFGTSADFADAKSAADKAIASDKLTTSFSDLFSMNSENDNEIIFSVQYNSATVEGPTKGNVQQAHFCAYLDGQERGHKYTTSTLSPTLRMHQLFESSPEDERYEGTFMTELRESYWDFYDAQKNVTSNVTYYYAPSWMCNEEAISEWRSQRESRKDAIIVEMKTTGNNVNNMATTYEEKLQDVYGVASFRKFDDTEQKGTFSTTASMHDVFLARLGETYLIAAEALVKQNKASEAVAYVNEVRGRANAKPASESDMNIDYILDERARELAGEYHRWMDLRRTGKLISLVETYNPDVAVGGVGEKILRPIPLTAMELNPALTQNPGF